MVKRETIAAVMPTRNQLEFLEAAVMSVYVQVDKLVVVDDRSTDGTREKLEDLENELRDLTVLWPTEWLHTHGAINLGMAWLRDWEGSHPMDWHTWVSSDNVHLGGWRTEMMKASAPDVGVIYSAYYRRKPNGRRSVFSRPYDPKRLINDQNCFFGPSFVIRRDVWIEAGDHRGAISHDYDHWLRVEEVCWKRGLRIVHVPSPVCVYNAHAKRRTHTERDTYDADKWQEEARKRRGV